MEQPWNHGEPLVVKQATLELFTYGTLRIGGPLHDYYLGGSVQAHRQAKVSGSLYVFGGGAYPVADVYADGFIIGDSFTVVITENVLAAIAMEMGAGYLPVHVDEMDLNGNFTGREVLMFHYPYVRGGNERIATGDWFSWLRSNGRGYTIEEV